MSSAPETTGKSAAEYAVLFATAVNSEIAHLLDICTDLKNMMVKMNERMDMFNTRLNLLSRRVDQLELRIRGTHAV